MKTEALDLEVGGLVGEKKIAVDAEKKTIPFAVIFAEVAESSTLLKKGLEIYDDPTTVETTGDRPDAHTDEG